MNEQKKSILIFSEAFLPPAYLPRVRYFCSYFAQKGWNVHLVLEESDADDFIPKDIEVLSVNYYKNRQGIIARIEWFTKFIFNLFWDYKGYYFKKKSQQFIVDKKFDLVFSSSCFCFPLTTADKIAKNLNLPHFVDLRDIPEQSPNDNHYIANKPPKLIGNFITEFYKNINIKRRNKVLKNAAAVTTVSPWHVQTLSKYNSKTVLIYNGFDETKFFPVKKATEQFTISYFGRIYNEEMRNPRLLFEAIHKLSDRNILTSSNTVVKWFVDADSKKVIQKISREYQLESFAAYFEFISPKELNEEMNKSSILLTLSNVASKKQYFGIMTTKFFESLGVNRPVLCIPDNNDNLSALVKETKCGLVSSSAKEVEDFVLEKFTEWEKSKQTDGLLEESVRMNYSRQKGAEILENLFLNTTK